MRIVKFWLCGAFLLFICSVATLSIQAAQRYSIQPLPLVEGQIDVFANGINNLNQVVGYVVDAQGSSHAVSWQNGQVELLEELVSEIPFSEAFRINDAGQIVGKSRVLGGFLHATLWDNSGVIDVGTLAENGESFASDINDFGVVVGSSVNGTSSNAFSWTPEGGFVDFGNVVPPSRIANAGFNGINNHGLMVGTTFFLLEPFRAALAREGDTQLTDLSPPGRTLGMALAVNDAGTIVGYQNDDSGSPQATIFHEDGKLEFLGTLGLDESWAQDVNDGGVIVGRAFSFDGEGRLLTRALVYQDGQMLDLLRQIDNPGQWVLIDGAGINNHGVIVGTGYLAGEIRGYIATPVPEPVGSHVAMGVACTWLWCSGRRRSLSRSRCFTKQRGAG